LEAVEYFAAVKILELHYEHFVVPDGADGFAFVIRGAIVRPRGGLALTQGRKQESSK